jgi:hypothetical protein
MNEQTYQVTLDVAPSLEELVVDCLLLLESERGFNSYPVYAHHHENKGLSLAEQVSGRQKKVRFQIYVAEQALAILLAQLKQEFSGAGIQYWVLPVLEHGVI